MALGPREAAGSCIERARRFLDLADADSSAAGASADLRRMAVVMAVAAIDTYLHAAIVGSIGGFGTALTKSLSRMEVPITELVHVADGAVRARHKGIESRPRTQVKNALHRRLLRMTFQSSNEVAEGLAAAGITNLWTRISDQLGEPPTEIRAQLDRIVRRRNQIVHEGDLRRLVRPQKLKFNRVLAASIRKDVDWIDGLLDAIHDLFT